MPDYRIEVHYLTRDSSILYGAHTLLAKEKFKYHLQRLRILGLIYQWT